MASLSVISFACSANCDHLHMLENNIGKLLLLHDEKYSYQIDLNSFGAAEIYNDFLEIYNINIKLMPKKYRINYFWFSMWHLGFDGHYMVKFQELIMQDCGEDFIDKLQKYVSKEQKLKRYKSRLYLSKKVLEGLKMIREKK